MLKELLDLARQEGADLAGWASLDRGELTLYSLLGHHEARRYRSALVIGKKHSAGVLDPPRSLPHEAYDQDYRRLNAELNGIILFLEDILKKRGVQCRAINPSQTIDTVHHRGLVSHRALAERAGLGVRGRNNLLVTVQHRSRIRLASLLTELPVPRLPKIVWPNPCTGCELCLKACPAGALGDTPGDFRLDLCMLHLDRIHKEGLSSHICGLCLAVCPGIEMV